MPREIKRRKRKKGAQQKFHRTRCKRIYDALGTTPLPLTRVCELAGITYQCYRMWMRKGRDPTNIFHARFRDRVKLLLSKREIEALEIVKKAAKGGTRIRERKMVRGPRGTETTTIRRVQGPNWKAAVRYLELTAREIYGPKADYPIHEEEPIEDKSSNVKVDISGTVDHNAPELVDQLRLLKEDQLEQLANIVKVIGESRIPGIPSGASLPGRPEREDRPSPSGKVSPTIH